MSGEAERTDVQCFAFDQIYLEGQASLEEAMESAELSKEPWPSVKRSWLESCKSLHPNWEFKVWNASAMESFTAEHYSWFLPTYKSYPRDIHRGLY